MPDSKREVKANLRTDSWGNCLIFVFFVFFSLNLWQTVHERWLVERIIDPETGAMSVEFHAEYVALGLIGIAVLVGIWAVRRREAAWRFLRSTRLGIVLITSVLVGTALGTLVFQNAQDQDYINFYSEFLFSFFKAVHMLDLFASWWFLALLVLLAANLVACTLHRKPWSLPKLGFLATHAGIVLVIVGAFVGGVLKQEGAMLLGEGQSTDYAASQEYVRMVGDNLAGLLPENIPERFRLPLGATLALEDFEELHYDDPFVVRCEKLRTRENARTGEQEPSWHTEQEIKFTDRRPLTLSGRHGVLRIAEVFPRVEGVSRLVENEAGRTLVEVEFATADWTRRVVLAEGTHLMPVFGTADEILLPDPQIDIRRYVSRIAFRLRMVWEPPDGEVLRGLGISEDESPYNLLVQTGGVGGGAGHLPPLPLRAGEEVEIEGTDYSVELLRFFHDLQVNTGEGEPELANASERLRNPAVEIRFGGGDLEPTNLVLTAFGSSPDQEKLDDVANRLGITLRFFMARTPVDLLVVGSREQMLVFRSGAVQESVDLSAESVYSPPLSGIDLRLLNTSRAAIGTTPAVVVEVGDGERLRSAALECADLASPVVVLLQPERFFLPLGDDTQISLRVRGDYIKEWRSRVGVFDGDEKIGEHVIRVNEPLVLNGFYFYQQSWYPQLPYGGETDRYFTYLQVVRDPGLWIVYLGLALIVLGIAYNFYVRPRLRGGARREEDGVE